MGMRDEDYDLLKHRGNNDTGWNISMVRAMEYKLPDLDNFEVDGRDPGFYGCGGWYLWYELFTLTIGVERASVIMLANELFNGTEHALDGARLLSTQIRETQRKMALAKAMCLMYREMER